VGQPERLRPTDVEVKREGDTSSRETSLVGARIPIAKGKYWGDLHAQSDRLVGTGSEEDISASPAMLRSSNSARHQANRLSGD
jgi:hypothetical protein